MAIQVAAAGGSVGVCPTIRTGDPPRILLTVVTLGQVLSATLDLGEARQLAASILHDCTRLDQGAAFPKAAPEEEPGFNPFVDEED